MADLDDFFAKKDKKKSKAKKAVTSVTPSVGGSSEQAETSAAVATPAPKKTEKKKETDAEASKKIEEDEWADFQEEREKDYSGLKIQKLQIQEADDNASQASSEPEFNEEGEAIKREPSGPWNKVQAGSTPAPAAREAEVVPSLPNTAGGVYVPPSKRGGQQPTEMSTSRARGARKNIVPDMNKEENFPTLSAAIAIDQAAPKTKKQLEQSTIGFTEAKHSRSHSSRGAAPGEEGPRLNLGNKFDALSENS